MPPRGWGLWRGCCQSRKGLRRRGLRVGADLEPGGFERAGSLASVPASSHLPGVPGSPIPQTQASSQPLEGRADTGGEKGIGA